MTEIVLKVPDDMPLPGLISRLNDLIAEEHLKWMLFAKSVDELAVDKRDMMAFEDMRAQVWNEEEGKTSDCNQYQYPDRCSCQGLFVQSPSVKK